MEAPAKVLEQHPSDRSIKRKRQWLSYEVSKNVLDRVVALVAIVVFSPIMALIAIGIRIDSPGSPIFAQERVGRLGRRFKAYKFRSLRAKCDDSDYKAYLRKYVLENAPYRLDQNGRGIYKVDSAAVTRFGAVLRKTNLDELPQFFNVLKGEMSLVGPRPDVPFAVDMYNQWHRERLGTKPGITGLWQVCGRKGISFEDMVRLDIEYTKRQSLILDARILLSTIGIILKRDGS